MFKFIALSLFFVCSLSHAASWTIHYPRPLSDADMRDTYPVRLLSLALDQTGVNYKLVPSDKVFLKNKALQRLAANREVNVVWSSTNKQREQELLPIRIPIYKGLIGWRVLLIRDDMAERFKYIQEFEHLLKLVAVQGRGWPDTKILQTNGFEVSTSDSYAALFGMIRQARADFFPRSVVEVWSELENTNLSNQLSLEPTIGIRYPTALYYFVNKNSVPLANLLEKGLEIAIANGKFDELFFQIHQDMIEKSKLNERRFFNLENTFLPAATPLDQKELWFQP
jgi:hypothetical protein